MELKDKEYYKGIINKCLGNDVSDKDIHELRRWINSSEKNRQEFFELKKIWLITSQASPRGRFNRAKYEEWNKLYSKISPEMPSSNSRTFSVLRYTSGIAAVILLFIAIGVTLAWLNTAGKLREITSAEKTYEIIVPHGGKSEIIMPDGSRVNLNAGSVFSYSGNFGFTDRKVFLEGEGYFEVESDCDMPFVVTASDIQIHALGTVFNVKAYPDEEEVITTLVEGVVKIRGDNIDLTMSPDQRVTYIRGRQPSHHKEDYMKQEEVEEEKISPRIQTEEAFKAPILKLANNINTLEITAWKEGVFIFNSERLKDLAVRLERRFDVTIEIESEELKNHVFTGTFHQETLEQILNVINISAPIKYQIEQGTVIIQSDSNREALFRELSKI